MKTLAKILLFVSAGCATNATTARQDPLEPIIWRHTKAVELDSKQLKCLADNIYYEARGEPVEGQIAVAQVTLNRVNAGHWGNRVCDVVYYKRAGVCQFSWVCMPRAKPDKNQHAKAQVIAQRTADYLYTDVQYRYRYAQHFHSNKVQPKWHTRLKKVTQTGNHIFYE